MGRAAFRTETDRSSNSDATLLGHSASRRVVLTVDISGDAEFFVDAWIRPVHDQVMLLCIASAGRDVAVRAGANLLAELGRGRPS